MQTRPLLMCSPWAFFHQAPHLALIGRKAPEGMRKACLLQSFLDNWAVWWTNRCRYVDPQSLTDGECLQIFSTIEIHHGDQRRLYFSKYGAAKPRIFMYLLTDPIGGGMCQNWKAASGHATNTYLPWHPVHLPPGTPNGLVVPRPTMGQRSKTIRFDSWGLWNFVRDVVITARKKAFLFKYFSGWCVGLNRNRNKAVVAIVSCSSLSLFDRVLCWYPESGDKYIVKT